MFRSGRTGVALVIIRLCLVGTLLLHLFRFGPIMSWSWTVPAIILIATALALGGATVPACVSFCGAEVGYRLTLDEFDGGMLMLSVAVGIALAMLGPGAYSIDAKIFGRRIIVLPQDGDRKTLLSERGRIHGPPHL
jgi:hypothetical protein